MLKGKFYLLWLLFLFGIIFCASSQPRFEIPGQFVFDIYVNQLNESTAKLPLKTWSSRGVNIYYLQEIKFANDKLSLNPGIGISSEKFSFSSDITLERQQGTSSLVIKNLSPSWDVHKTFLSAEYFDIPIELRFQTAKGYRAFRFAVGFRVGRLIHSRTKIKYENFEGDIIKIKEQNNYLLNRWRYGVIARIGLGKLNVFGAYNLSPLFQENALEQEVPNYNPSSFTLGITFFTF